MISEKLSGVRSMRELVAAVAGPVLPTDTRESWLRRAARNGGVSYRQARALFYGEIVDPYHRTCTRFREAAGRHEARNLAAQFESLAHALHVRDADFHQSDIDCLLSAARALGGLNNAGTNHHPKGTVAETKNPVCAEKTTFDLSAAGGSPHRGEPECTSPTRHTQTTSEQHKRCATTRKR